MRTNAYHERYRAYRWTRRWPTAAWMALTEDGRALVILLLVLATFLWAYEAHAQAHVRRAWYYHLTPRQGGSSCLVGPFFSRATAADNLGSALYSHPFACHDRWSPANCANIGNGYGYPKQINGVPITYPPAWQIPDSGPVLLPFVATHEHGKWVRFYYGDDGSCTVVLRGQKPPATQGQFTNYADVACPGWPWIFVGDSGAPGGDGVCG